MEKIIEMIVPILIISAGIVIGKILANILWYYIEKFFNKH